MPESAPMPGAGLDRLRRRALDRLRYETVASNAWYLVRRSLSPLATLDLWVVCRRDLTQPLAPLSARIPIEVKLASEAELDAAARLDGAPESDAQWLRPWVRVGNACFVAKVGSEIVARGLLCTGSMHFGSYGIVLRDDEAYLTGGYTAQAWRGNRIHLELEYRRLLAAQQAGAMAAYTLASVDNTRSLRNSLRTGCEATGLVLCIQARWAGSPRVWRIRGSLHPFRLSGKTPMNDLLADNDVFEFEGCLLVIPRREPRLFLLNQTARMIWQQLADGVLPDEAADGLAARFDVPAAQVRADMAAILAEWWAHELLTGAPSPDAAHRVDGPVPAAAARSPVRRFHAERVYQLCGRPIRVRWDEPAFEQAIHPPLAHAADPAGDATDTVEVVRDGAGFLVVCNGSDIERAATEEEALGEVFGRILELSYPDAEWLAVMHAAAVGDARGAVVMPADSGSGKSTLTAALVHAGLRYFSDDLVPLDAALRIRPMPLGVSLKEGSWPVLAARYPELDSLPIHAGRRRRYLPIAVHRHGPPAGLPVKSLVFPHYRPNQPTTLRPLPALEVLEKLASARSWLSLDGRRFGVTLQWIEETLGYDLGYASLEEAVPAIEGLLNGERGANRP
jgi:Coenzyme PQQ synthesis protein D (PqqD)